MGPQGQTSYLWISWQPGTLWGRKLSGNDLRIPEIPGKDNLYKFNFLYCSGLFILWGCDCVLLLGGMNTAWWLSKDHEPDWYVKDLNTHVFDGKDPTIISEHVSAFLCFFCLLVCLFCFVLFCFVLFCFGLVWFGLVWFWFYLFFCLFFIESCIFLTAGLWIPNHSATVLEYKVQFKNKVKFHNSSLCLNYSKGTQGSICG